MGELIGVSGIVGLPAPPALAGLTWRRATIDDAGSVAALLDACFEMDGGYRITAAEVRDDLLSEDGDPTLDTLMAFDTEGNLVAMAWCQIPGGAVTEQTVFDLNRVRPDWRRMGLGAFLLSWTEARARQRPSSASDRLPAVFRADLYEWQSDRVALYRQFGYEPARYFVEMARALTDIPPPSPPPEGVDILSWEPGLSERVREAHNAAFADHYGSQPITPAHWQAGLDEFFLPWASRIAVEAARPVAYLLAHAYPHDFEDRARREAWIESLGTIRSHRRRGIATTLLLEAMRELRDAGYEYACLGVDTESPTRALALYEKLGFTVERSRIEYAKVLS